MGSELKRVYIFCDHANVFHNLEEQKIRINYRKLKEILSDHHKLVGAIIFMGLHKEIRSKKDKFMNYLEKAGWAISDRTLMINEEGSLQQSGVDKLMGDTILVFGMESFFDKAIIVSGDSDFIPTIRAIKKMGKEIEIWSFKASLSRALIDEVGYEHIHFLDNFLSQLRI